MYKKDRLTSCIFQPADGIGKKSYAAQEARPLSFMDLFVVPYTDGDRVCLSNVAENRTQNEILRCLLCVFQHSLVSKWAIYAQT